MDQKRKEIRRIQRDSTLSSQEKVERIQRLMNPLEDRISQKSNENNECNHYKKKCSQFYFSCCGIYDPCRRCHLERNHCKDPKIETIKCLECKTEQKPSNECIKCKIKFSNYYCDKCYLWSDDGNIYHCDECGLCRKGKRDHFFHCNICKGCFNKENHICINYNYKNSQCSLCHEELFSSYKSYFQLPCKHLIHNDCFEEYIKHSNFSCPICRKSMFPMEHIWVHIRQKIKEEPIPKNYFKIVEGDKIPTPYGIFKVETIKEKYYGSFIEWRLKDGTNAFGILDKSIIQGNKYKDIYCNDCNKSGLSLFHFYGFECKFCKGFNTQE